jgi:hypothetical protein
MTRDGNPRQMVIVDEENRPINVALVLRPKGEGVRGRSSRPIRLTVTIHDLKVDIKRMSLSCQDAVYLEQRSGFVFS